MGARGEFYFSVAYILQVCNPETNPELYSISQVLVPPVRVRATQPLSLLGVLVPNAMAAALGDRQGGSLLGAGQCWFTLTLLSCAW